MHSGVLERFCRPSYYVSIILDNKSMVGIEKQRNTHTHTMGYHLPFGRISMIKKKKEASAGENVEQREPFCTVGRSVHWYSHHGGS